MSDASIGAAGVETRQAMLRVWMAISAVWVAFWISIAGFVVLTGLISNPLFERLHLVVLIVVAPPLALLVLGATFRLIFETIARRIRNA